MSRAALLGMAALLVAGHAGAQQVAVDGGAGAILAGTVAWPMPHRRTIAEARIVQPTAMADVRWRSLAFTGMVDLEAWTMDHGQLSPGAWGEGFIDRRHPHTFFHELIASWTDSLAGGLRVSLAAGKGFAPFGTDDPMNRPVVLYPINHHWSQIPERAVAVLAVRSGRVALEAGAFNGDEPAGPWSWPKLSRFGDSWSARLLVWPSARWELQLSHASVRSPEHRDPPLGPRNEKWSASARFSADVRRGPTYGLIELARTAEPQAYYSFLAEADQFHRGRHEYVRLEVSERPEPVRGADPFRYPSPDSLIGASRWYVASGGIGWELHWRGARVEPFAEWSGAAVFGIRGDVSPPGFYGDLNLWSVTLGVRMGTGMPVHRMGRYGVLHEPMATAMPRSMPGMRM